MLGLSGSLFPVFAVILFGYAAKHYKFLTGDFWPSCEKLAYYVLLPLILFINISTAKYDGIEKYIPMIGVSLLTVFIVVSITFFIKYIFKIKSYDFTSLLQGSIYANAAYIGIPASYALYGKEGLLVYSILLAVIVPVVNATTVIILSVSSNKEGRIRDIILKNIVFHPIIMSCLIAALFNYYNIVLPAFIFSTLDIFAKAAVPVGLIIVGGALDIKSIKGSMKYISSTALIKLVISPVIAIYLARHVGVEGVNAAIAVMYATLPAAAATYVIAKKMNGNAELMASIIVVETVMSFATMPIALHFASAMFIV